MLIDVWQHAWPEFTPFLDYPVELRKIVYTTNQIESINFQLRKITKNRGHFDSNDAAMKLIYLGLRNISSETAGFSGTGTRNWTVALNTLATLFPGRIPLCQNTLRSEVISDLHGFRDRLSPEGTVISQLHSNHTAVEFKKFLAAIDKAVPAELDVHLVCDNLATHKTPTVRAWLDKHPRFHLHFTPTGSSWINQVERWFGFLTDRLLRRGVHKSVAALEKDVRDWIEQWNTDPKPFTWRKTADEILDSLAKYISRISGAAH